MFGQANGYIKQPVLSKKEKAAMLFCELGSYVTDDMLKYFSNAELKKLRKTIKGMRGHYNVYEENMVLEEAAKFGIMKGYLPANVISLAEEVASVPVVQKNNFMNNIAAGASDIAKVLSMWLKE